MKTLSIMVREVYNAMCEEYIDEVMTAPEEWKLVTYGLQKKWNFPKLTHNHQKASHLWFLIVYV